MENTVLKGKKWAKVGKYIYIYIYIYIETVRRSMMKSA